MDLVRAATCVSLDMSDVPGPVVLPGSSETNTAQGSPLCSGVLQAQDTLLLQCFLGNVSLLGDQCFSKQLHLSSSLAFPSRHKGDL